MHTSGNLARVTFDQALESLDRILFRVFENESDSKSDFSRKAVDRAGHFFNDSLLSGLRCGVLITDMRQSQTQAIVYANEGFYQLTGYRAEETLGKNCRFLQGKDTDSKQVEAIREAISRHEPFEGVLLNYRKNGQSFWNRLQLFPGFDKDQRLSFYLGIQTDVSNQVELESSKKFLEKLLQIAPCVMLKAQYEAGDTLQIKYASESTRSVLGIDATTLTGAPGGILDWVSPKDRPRVKARIGIAANNHSRISLDFEVNKLPNPDLRWLRLELMPDVKEGYWYGHILDVTSDQLQKQRLETASEFFLQSEFGIMITDTTGIIKDVNEAFCKITGYNRSEALEQPASLLRSGLHPMSFYTQIWQALEAQGCWKGQIRNRRKNGEFFQQAAEINTLYDAEGIPTHYITSFSDLTSRQLNLGEVNRLLNYDLLTGLPNRVRFLDITQSTIEQATLLGQKLAVCVIDIDNFLALNQQLSTINADRLLCQFAEHVNAARPRGSTLSRSTGDEFLLLIPDVGDQASCHVSLLEIVEALRTPFVLDNLSVEISASFGCTIYPDDNVDHDRLLRHAGEAMLCAKRRGLGQISFFDPFHEAERGNHDRLRLAALAGLEKNEFVFYFQPVIRLKTGEIVGFEALARWHHPQRGLLSPGEFLPIFQDSLAIGRFGEWTIREAFKEIAHLREMGLKQSLALNINIDPQFFTSNRFVELLDEMFFAYPDIQGADLTLEVLENSNFDDFDDVRRVSLRCRELGIRVALDDFGTGFSSLSHLTKFPVDTLKIDQSFIRGLLDTPENLMITEGVLQLTRLFELESVAEGVENATLGVALIHMGCEFAQGYGIARPMPAEALSEWCFKWEPPHSWVLAANASIPVNEWMLMVGHLKIVNHHQNLSGYQSLKHLRLLQSERPTCPLSEAYGELSHWITHQGHRYYRGTVHFSELEQALHRYRKEVRKLVRQVQENPDELQAPRTATLDACYDDYTRSFVKFIAEAYRTPRKGRLTTPSMLYFNRVMSMSTEDQLSSTLIECLEEKSS